MKIYEDNFKNSVSLNIQEMNQNKTFLEFKPDFKFIEDIAFTLVNVINDKKNSYIHGYLLSSYLKRYISNISKKDKKLKSLNILDMEHKRIFFIMFGKVLDDFKVHGKIFTFDVLPIRLSLNSPSDILSGKISRLNLLKKWQKLVNNHIIFFSTATFNSLRVVDIPVINFAFIDGSHEFEDVFFEVRYIISRLSKNAILIFDDYDKDLFPGVVKACDYLLSLKIHANCEFIKIQNHRNLAIFTFGNI